MTNSFGWNFSVAPIEAEKNFYRIGSRFTTAFFKNEKLENDSAKFESDNNIQHYVKITSGVS